MPIYTPENAPQGLKVYLDGAYQHDALWADTDAGRVVCLVRDADGRLVDDGVNMARQELRGSVEGRVLVDGECVVNPRPKSAWRRLSCEIDDIADVVRDVAFVIYWRLVARVLG